MYSFFVIQTADILTNLISVDWRQKHNTELMLNKHWVINCTCPLQIENNCVRCRKSAWIALLEFWMRTFEKSMLSVGCKVPSNCYLEWYVSDFILRVTQWREIDAKGRCGIGIWRYHTSLNLINITCKSLYLKWHFNLPRFHWR